MLSMPDGLALAPGSAVELEDPDAVDERRSRSPRPESAGSPRPIAASHRVGFADFGWRANAFGGVSLAAFGWQPAAFPLVLLADLG